MTSIEIKSKVSLQDLLSGVEQLELKDLENFVEKVLKIRAQRVAPGLTKKESELLSQINRPIPEELKTRFATLDNKRQEEQLTEKEHKELIEIVTEIEKLNVGRLKNLGELAQIRKISLPDLMKQLGIGLSKNG